MDEMWQRHKSFIVQVLVGGVLFLVAFFVMRSMYGDENDPERVRAKNASRLDDLRKKLEEGNAPDAASIAEQRRIADLAETRKGEMARRVASVAGAAPDAKDADRERAYVGENIQWTASVLQRDPAPYAARYDRVPQACLSSLRDDSRGFLTSKAAQNGKELDETLGLTSFPDHEIPQVLHGLAIVTDLASACLDPGSGIDKVLSLRVSARSSFPETNEVNVVSAIGVHMEIQGDPLAVAGFIRKLNEPASETKRVVVLESVESIAPLSADEDIVKASINLVGLRYKADKPAEGQ
jgi:hypothetical protein